MGKTSPPIIDSPSPNFNERQLPVSLIVLHYTGMESCAAAHDRLRDPDAGVSAHYLVAEDGTIMQLVAEDRRAWHAGQSYWRGIRDVNSASIGIEICNPGHEWGYTDFPAPQIDSVMALLPGIMARHGVRRDNVIGHSDIAPERKTDPGELFPWQRLAEAGLAESIPEAGTDPNWSDKGVKAALERFGYEARDLPAAVTAFQRRWRPHDISGEIDAETRAILLALLERRSAEELILGNDLPRL
ncbi:N-acetylmuramoyl-L-alanine amidase [Pacificimonas flava]|uniref:N-acetylmuramoyl-L-alanine amidase n=2 Tax=Pacificimonas TaxID=1960290 RepID=A0A219B1J1_9SPHN|nr:MULTISPECIES: N-acetylmuramoyl-L-alanine amidase [Pacificimonas]MBZ6378329.1 N-acetylmuramoyl-L-alanine amidase [Pacificimonas aurantium]OWV32064.1 N-acetylmuramoyl-L-alanine amidase [Pacificimonas flava]